MRKMGNMICFFFSSRRRHTRWPRDWSSDVCSSDLDAEDGYRKDRQERADADGGVRARVTASTIMSYVTIPMHASHQDDLLRLWKENLTGLEHSDDLHARATWAYQQKPDGAARTIVV